MLKTTKILTMMLVLMMGMSFASCDEFLSSNDNPVSPNLKVQTTSLTVQVGKTAKCKATASSKARLTFFSSDESIATVSTGGVVKGISVGTTYVTALASNPAGRDIFLEESVIITVNVVEKSKKPDESGTMTVTAEGYSGTYDGAEHGIKVTAPEGATVKFGETEGTYDKTSSPTYTNAGTYIVYYEVTNDNYKTVTGSATVTINKAAGSISFATASIAKTFGDDAFTNELTNTGDGKVTYESSNSAVAEVNTTTGEVTIKGNGDATIKATVADDDNYTYENKTASYTLGVGTATMTVTATGYSGTYDGYAHGITVNAPDGASIKFGTTAGNYTETTSPKYTDADTYTIYYQVTKDNYTTVTNSAQVIITKKAGEFKYENTSVQKNYGELAFTNPLTKTGDGAVNYVSNNTNVATVNNSTGEVTIVGTGTAKITATVTDGTNYTYTQKTAEFTLTVYYSGGMTPMDDPKDL